MSKITYTFNSNIEEHHTCNGLDLRNSYITLNQEIKSIFSNIQQSRKEHEY